MIEKPDVLDDDGGDGHPSASKRREAALRLAVAEARGTLDHLRAALLCVIETQGELTVPLDRLREKLGKELHSRFNVAQDAIIFSTTAFTDQDVIDDQGTPA